MNRRFNKSDWHRWLAKHAWQTMSTFDNKIWHFNGFKRMLVGLMTNERQ